MNILRIIAWKNLKKNRKRTLATIVGIIVSVALISFIFTLVYSFKDSMIETTKRNIGNYHIHIGQLTTLEVMKLNQIHDKIENIGISQTIGAADYETQIYAKQGIRIEGYDETALKNRDIRLIEGRVPQNEKEILISSYLVNNMNEPIRIGDKLILDVQKVKLVIHNNGKEESLEPDGIERISYTVSGIIKQTMQEASSLNSYIAITKLEHMTEVRPCEVTILFKNAKEEKIFYNELMNSRLKNHLSENNKLLLWQSTSSELNEKSQLELIESITIILVIVITITLIKNSFQISISERIKEFGTLISIGATSTQIKRIVLIEGLIYAIISIPIGLILGIGIVFFSTNGIGNALENMYGNDWNMQFSVSFLSILATILLTLLSIFISCMKPIKEAKKASPIETIKQNNEILIKNKDVRISKLMSRILEIEEKIAYKNIKRNKRKYRSTTISISTIMILVIIVSSIIQYIFCLVNDVYQPTSRSIDVAPYYGEGQEEISTIFENFDRIKTLDDIIEYSTIVRFNGFIKEDEKVISIYAYEGKIYENYLASLGLKYEDNLEAGILLTTTPSIKESEKLNILIKEKEYLIPIIKITNINPDVAISELDESKIEKKHDNSNDEILIISNDMAKNIDIDDGKNRRLIGGFSMDMRINSNDPNQLEQEILQFVNNDKIYVINYSRQKEDAQRLSIIMSIFLYGLLLVISLIGITNIYNTIVASINLRKNEFEVMKTIGMSNKQFKKMFAYESLLYGVKSLVLGTVLGIALSFGIYSIIKSKQPIEYYLPVIQIILTLILTIIVIRITIQTSWKKLNKTK